MKVSYFPDTDTLYIELRTVRKDEAFSIDTHDFEETQHTLVETDSQGAIVALTIEQASQRVDLEALRVEGLLGMQIQQLLSGEEQKGQALEGAK